MRNLSLFLIYLLGIGSLPALETPEQVTSKSIEATLSSMSKEDYAALDCFFRRMLLQDQFAYVLFGDKPVALSDYSIYDGSYPSMGELVVSLCRANIQRKYGCTVWEKYKNHFRMKNYLLLTQEDESNNCVSIVIINKKNFLRKFNQNSDIFCRILGKEMTGKKLLQQIEIEGILKKETLNNSEELLGILLGFGKKNSWLYQREQEFEIEKQTQLIQDPVKTSFLFMKFIAFRVDPNDPETKELKKKYTKQRKEITKIYRENKFLETTLKRLCS